MASKFNVSDNLLQSIKDRFDQVATIPTLKVEHESWSDPKFIGDEPKSGKYIISTAYDHPYMLNKSFCYKAYPIVVHNNIFFSLSDDTIMPEGYFFDDLKRSVLRTNKDATIPYSDIVYIGKVYFENESFHHRFMKGEIDYVDFFRFYDVTSETHPIMNSAYKHRRALMDQLFLKRNEESTADRGRAYSAGGLLLSGMVDRLSYSQKSVFNLFDVDSHDLMPISYSVTLDERVRPRNKVTLKDTRVTGDFSPWSP
jgi:hypothetical protein